ncbi:MAG: YkgJ family cysteine cluster protein [Lachnospiraceae bacterium]|nr:YkgJ family cysteine cluster protein [Lachnospiraceae bacterium]
MKLYGLNDMVRTDCRDCQGCSTCCRGMGDTILVDPYDTYRMEKGIAKSFEELLDNYVELHVEDGLLLPNLRMEDEKNACVFLLEEGRCSIHRDRPGLCRAFPLGRNYEDGQLHYFLLEDCPMENKTKVKVEKWLGTPDPKTYQEFLIDWHYFVKDLKNRAAVMAAAPENQKLKEMNLLFLQTFYIRPYDRKRDFYEQYRERREEFCSVLTDCF